MEEFVPVRIRRDVEDVFFEEYRDGNKQIISCTDETEFVEQFGAHKWQECVTNNKHICSECRRIYPSAHLLDIHVTECHDSYFQLKSLKENSYRCLVETCPELHATSKLRHKHVVKKHNFPSDFRFESRPVKETVKKWSESDDKSEMEVDEAPKSLNPKVPTSICFGKGSNRGFSRRKSKK